MGQYVSSCCPCCTNGDYSQLAEDDSNNQIEISDTSKSTTLASSLRGGSSQSYHAPSSSAAVPSAVVQPTQKSSFNANQPPVILAPSVAVIDFDPNSSVFKGSVVQQKFFNKSTYEAKFAWINLKSKTLCLSEHMTKERRHKEASIADVTGVICGPPEKFKMTTTSSGEPIPLDSSMCLSVKFVRGGGIDLKFSSTKERDDWADVILRLLQNMKKNDLPRPQ